MLERISFVCQAGKLEPQAILLAASLRLNFPTQLKLIAAHPHLHGPLHPLTMKAFSDLRVDTVKIENPLDKAYLIGHKLAALSLLDGPGLGMFLDSDILALRSPEDLTSDLAAVPASAQICPLPIWHHIYENFGIAISDDVPATL
jgi:hypothetical protein